MTILKELDKLANRHEKRGAKMFYKALRTVQSGLINQYINGQPLEPNSDVIKKAMFDFHKVTQMESATWQFNTLERDNPIKALSIGIFERLLGFIQNWIMAYTGDLIVNITQTTLDRVRAIIVKGQSEGLGAVKIAALLRSGDERDFTAYRALVIARTEGTRAASAGHEAGAKQWENITGQIKWKAWSASVDKRTRDQHLAMLNSLPIRGDLKFEVGGELMQYPGDVNASAKNTVNCRCRAYYMSERAAKKIINK